MKRSIVAVLIAVLFIMSSGCSAVIENSKEQLNEEKPDYEFAKPIVRQFGDKLSIAVDPKIEAAYLVFEMISSDTGFSQYEGSTYMDDQMKHFEEFKDHEVFSIARKMAKEGFKYGAIASSLHLYDELNLKQGVKADKAIIELAGGMDNIEEFVKALYDFRKYSDYDSYFKSNDLVYLEYLSRADQYLNYSSFYEVFSAYYGDSDSSIRITITPDCTDGYGCVNRYEDKLELLPTINVGTYDKDFIGLLLHELSHPYVNPETSKRADAVSNTEELFKPISGQMSSQAYINWETSLNEHIVRANTIYMMGQIYGDRPTNLFLKRDEELGFKYIKPIYESIVKYAENRDQYMEFSQYFNKLMEDVEKIEPIN